MDLNDYKVHTANQSGETFIFSFLVSENPTLADYKVRSRLLAHCVAHYPLCASGSISDPATSINPAVVVATFVRRNG